MRDGMWWLMQCVRDVRAVHSLLPAYGGHGGGVLGLATGVARTDLYMTDDGASLCVAYRHGGFRDLDEEFSHQAAKAGVEFVRQVPKHRARVLILRAAMEASLFIVAGQPQ